MKKIIIVIFTLILCISLAACDEAQNNLPADGEVYTGYISLNGDTLNLDTFEIITLEDKSRMQELDLEETDMPDGYYFNALNEMKSFVIDDNTEYIFFDTSNLFVDENAQDKEYNTTDKEEFYQFLYRGEEVPMKVPFEVKMKDGIAVTIKEIFVN
ncbi:hypothetical protein [Sinanaerobacter sp. ZZT-01]|uniref:hypothetical protein n=1 Tax=Sinanaerobacter sp. ZZT-01 TaxID=3111540 RepID=UPI002D7A0582|nr:hypothetical protein [Sinanaerobacter sp. ZZT-01]WRR93016.1 hypothetical protein U5921_13395 [Sinanaerobacter sp. ZZT-01]